MLNKKNLSTIAALAAIASAAPALAQSTTDTKEFAVVGTVPALCSGGTISGDSATFDLGVLIDTSTGLLRNDLSAPDKTITGSFCSARSTINVDALPMTAQTFTATPPTGFSRTVHFVATASGWTETPASFNTAAATNPAATQNRDTAFSGDIAVALSDFATGGGNALRLVADPNYLGTVVVTLTAAE